MRSRFPRRTSRVLVLCYHAVADTWPAALSVPPAALRRQLEWLLARGWAPTTFIEAVMSPPAPRSFAVTFDDGFLSVRQRAAPILADLGVPGTLFVPTDWPGRVMSWPGISHWLETPYREELQAMSWEDVAALAAAGWEIGSHTRTHPHLVQLDTAAIERELCESRATCERLLGRPCRSIAYPFGEADDRVRAAAEAAGYEAAAGLSPSAFAGRSRFEWPRVGVWHGEPDWRFRLKVSPVVARLRRSRWVATADGLRGRVAQR